MVEHGRTITMILHNSFWVSLEDEHNKHVSFGWLRCVQNCSLILFVVGSFPFGAVVGCFADVWSGCANRFLISHTFIIAADYQ